MLYVPEGRFKMGADMDAIAKIITKQDLPSIGGDPESAKMAARIWGLLEETPEHTANTGAYYIDKTEVTNQQYKEFIDAKGYPAPAQWKDGKYPDGEGAFPVSGVSLADAQRYAEWRGCRLPTETEWEKAARGIDGRRFPWGDAWEANRARHMLPAGAGPVAVGSYPTWPSPYGCLDMIGNVQEWTTSDFAPYAGSLMEDAARRWAEGDARRLLGAAAPSCPSRATAPRRYPVDPAKADPGARLPLRQGRPGLQAGSRDGPCAAAAPSTAPATTPVAPAPTAATPAAPAPAPAAVPQPERCRARRGPTLPEAARPMQPPAEQAPPLQRHCAGRVSVYLNPDCAADVDVAGPHRPPLAPSPPCPDAARASRGAPPRGNCRATGP